ncbi:MAG: DUF421 domain-containing protein [Alphaproteobacteria bacterium]|uniref:DUF421 domain-containing protein n=1 Tax=Candidatus Nitrobium versatile TaxID=2884831 RepID=A0A953JBC7_9BACT|nr:DUF421 domain-containing protein [Candidatus Nitrobium versatile]
MFFDSWQGLVRVAVVGILAFAVLIYLQYAVTWLSVRFSKFQHFTKAEPALLFHKGQFLYKAMKKERVTEEEITAAVREQKIPSLEGAEAVVLETDGTFSVVRRSEAEASSSLSYVKKTEKELLATEQGVSS